MQRFAALSFLAALAAPIAVAADPAPPLAEKYLVEGKLAEGERALAAALAENPKDSQARFGLGTIQFLRGIERMIQSFHRYGLRDNLGNMVPFFRLPIPANPDPAPIRHQDFRSIFESWLADMSKVESTLAGLDDPDVKLPLRFGLIRLDFDGDGRATEEESLWKIYARLNGQAARNLGDEKPDEFVIAFDRGDVAWLRGYCHLLSAIAEVVLAHDGQELFDRSAHLIFAKPETPYDFLRARGQDRREFDSEEIIDLVAAVHLIRLPVAEPKRLAAALAHMEAVIALSRESWKFYMAETDNDREWIPNPKQESVIPGARVTAEMVQGWETFLQEAEALLAGKLLVPFWRGADDGRGINLRRVFIEPRELDLVLWVQGTAAVPYLEKGSVTNPEVWRRLQRLFDGEFIGFAIWFN